jgi:putative hydrolase of the HAD superfamily
MDPIVEIIRRLARPLAPVPTGVVPRLKRLDAIRAVLFDFYGTLFISGSGDISTAASGETGEAFGDAAALCGLVNVPDPAAAVGCLHRRIRQSHEVSRACGIDCPEVQIEAIWREVFVELAGAAPDEESLRRFAAVYESLANPVWPMPGVRDTLEQLRDAGIVLGIVSNAQFYTTPLFAALLGVSQQRLGFHDTLVHLSYVAGSAKPGRRIFEQAAESLLKIGIQRHETLYVGNDMLNDVAAASAVGFRTALFAGDRRSLRARDGDARVAGVLPDVVMTELPQLLELFGRT